jgi:predicted kinase
MSASEIVTLLGPSGAGKTWWWCGRYRSHQVLSLDELRLRLSDDIADQSVTPLAVELRRMMLEHRAQAGLATVIDATNARLEHRRPIVATASRWHRPTIAVVFHTPLELCLQRQEDIERTMPDRGQPNGRSTPAEAVAAQYDEIARVWDRMSHEADCVVHVSPAGDESYRVGDIPTPGGVRVDWLEETPALPSANVLPWRSPFIRRFL